MSEESKFDTMRLIAGAEDSDLYALDDIVQEFAVKPAAEEPAEEEPEAQPGTYADREADSEGGAGEHSKASMADAIAEAIAASFQPSEETTHSEPDMQNQAPEVDAESDSESDSEPAVEPQAVEEPKPAPVPKQEHKKQPEEKQKEVKEKQLPNVKTVQQAPAKETAKNKPQKIPKGHVSIGVAEMLGLMLGDLRTRQRAALPPSKASLKSAEKSNAMITKIGGVMTPVRYIVLLLMVLALAGRRFHWMTLGFLGGATGMTIAMIVTVISLAVGWQSVVKGVRDVFFLRGSYETLLLITTLLSLVDTAASKNENTLLPLLAISWCVSGTAALMTTRGNLRSLRTVITGRTRKGVRLAPGKWENTDCIGKASASTTGYVRRLEEHDTFHGGWSVYGWGLLVVSLILSAYLTAKTQGNYLSILVTLLTVSLPVSLVLGCARPYELLTRVLGGKAAVSGWSGLKTMSGHKAVLIYDGDLFPEGTISHKGVRVYGKQTPRLLVSYAASLVLRADNGLGDVFTRLLNETDGQLYDVSYFQIMEGGLVGRIHGVLVAVGTYNFMQLMGSIPPSKAPKNGIYISLNGEVAGVFAIQYRVLSGADDAFERLVKDRTLTPLIATRNFCVNPSFVENWFHAPVAELACPKAELRRSLSEPSLLVRGTTCGYVMKDGVTVYSRLVAGGRRVYRTGAGLTGLSVVLSLVMLVRTVMQISAGTAVIGGPQLLLMQIILLLVVELAARFSIK